VYTDSKEARRGLQTQGLNKKFGFFINRPFYIESYLPMNRVVEVVSGRKLVIKRRIGVGKKNEQIFFFDGLSKTIRSKAFKSRAIDIQNAGRTNRMQIWTTNARWF